MVDRLFDFLQAVSLSQYVSFQRNRLRKKRMKDLISQMKIVGYINKKTKSDWTQEMQLHNRVIARGMKLGMNHTGDRMKWMEFLSLDIFMLQMHSQYLSKVLYALSEFGDSVLASMQANPGAPYWNLKGPIVIDKSNWCKLCRRVMALLQFLGLDYARQSLSRWPDRSMLEAAAERAERLFGRFSAAKFSSLTIFSFSPFSAVVYPQTAILAFGSPTSVRRHSSSHGADSCSTTHVSTFGP